MATTTNSKIIQATKEKIYNAFTDKNALEFWLAPNNMVGKIHDFDLKVGGGYNMSLFYLDSEALGKTSGNEDRFSAKFVELKLYEKIVQTINFQSDKNEFTDEMIMEVFFKTVENNSTKVTIIFKNIPTGIGPKDNETGTEQSLDKLARYVDKKLDR
ncbi:MAG: SRPBCC domain-containing protein [Salinivirgaceae bacterium]|nr:SRPBCC domain-containing protein [Salinivirgaceae bacterium]